MRSQRPELRSSQTCWHLCFIKLVTCVMEAQCWPLSMQEEYPCSPGIVSKSCIMMESIVTFQTHSQWGFWDQAHVTAHKAADTWTDTSPGLLFHPLYCGKSGHVAHLQHRGGFPWSHLQRKPLACRVRNMSYHVYSWMVSIRFCHMPSQTLCHETSIRVMKIFIGATQS